MTQGDLAHPQLVGGCPQLSLPQRPEVGATSESARLAVAKAKDTHRAANFDQGGEERPKPEALVVGMGHHGERWATTGNLT